MVFGDASSLGQTSARQIDALCVFTVLFAQCLALQVAKDVQTLGWDVSASWRLLPTVALAIAVLNAHLHPTDTQSPLALAATGAIALTVNGSQSNHVVLELVMCVAILLAAPAQCFNRTPTGSSYQKRESFRSNLTNSMRLVLATLYTFTGFAKLNYDWHKPSVSCCVQMFVAALSGCGVSPTTIAKIMNAPYVQHAMPTGATAFELLFPVVMLIAVTQERKSTADTDGKKQARDHVLLRLLAIGGSLFHVLIALPPPPMSVYPFSMLMAPHYVIALVPESVTACVSFIFNKWQDEARIAVGIGVSTLFAHTYQVSKQNDTHLFEYPSYGSWRVGVLWNVLAFGGICVVSRLGGRDDEEETAETADEVDATSTTPPPATAEESSQESSKKTSPKITMFAKIATPALIIALVSLLPYFGLRTYPAFAMFSNLRVEGGASNHFLLGGRGGAKPSDYLHSYGADVSIQIVETDLLALRNLQINLAPLVPRGVLRALELSGIVSEFHITPPAWRIDNPEAQKTGSRARPTSVPLVEVRRRVAGALFGSEKVSNFEVKYQWVLRGVAETGTHTFRVKNGAVVGAPTGRDAVLGVDVPKWRLLVHRFRTFDVQGDSVCRH